MKQLRVLFVLLLLALAALACNAPQTAATPVPDLAQVVAMTQTALAVAPAATQPAAAPTLQPGAPTLAPTASGASAATPGAAPAVTAPPPADDPNCTNLAKFVGETVPDGSQFPPNAAFMKNWTIQNAGTCTWTPQYSLVFQRGEQMGGTSPQPLGQNVAPNGQIQIYLPQTAPAAAGDHQGFWMLRTPGGKDFALGQDGQTAFWVKINVNASAPAATQAPPAPPAAVSNLGPPTRSWAFNDKQSPFYIGDDDDIGFALSNNQLVLTAFRSAGDQWRVAELSYVQNFALETRFLTGAQCSGRDGYGMLVRAPSQADSIIDTGYVFGFNCDGQFRAYRMDSGAYTGLANWANHPAIKAGANQENVMTVVGQGAVLRLYANGTLLMELNDATYPGGLFGLMIASGGTPNFQTAVRGVSLWALP